MRCRKQRRQGEKPGAGHRVLRRQHPPHPRHFAQGRQPVRIQLTPQPARHPQQARLHQGPEQQPGPDPRHGGMGRRHHAQPRPRPGHFRRRPEHPHRPPCRPMQPWPRHRVEIREHDPYCHPPPQRVDDQVEPGLPDGKRLGGPQPGFEVEHPKPGLNLLPRRQKRPFQRRVGFGRSHEDRYLGVIGNKLHRHLRHDVPQLSPVSGFQRFG